MRRALTTTLLLSLILAGCASAVDAPVDTPTLPTDTVDPSDPTDAVDDRFYDPAFDGDRALEQARRQVLDADGRVRHRIPGTPGNDAVAAYLAATMDELGFATSYHHFNATYGCEQVAMHNVVADRPGTSGRMVVFGAHYDTRPIADKDPDASRRAEPNDGAVDGASGVAVLLELARVLPASNDAVRFVFFDGEDGGSYQGAQCTEWILGSRAYATSLEQAEIDSMAAFVLVDMVGDPEMRLPYEMNTRADTPSRQVQDAIYLEAELRGHDAFVRSNGYGILDDHVPFLERMVPSVDLIHMVASGGVFPAWHHTHADTLAALDAGSLEQVGATLEAWFAARD